MALVTQQDAKQCDDGTTTKGMITTTEHNDGDWRQGLSWQQIIEGTKEAQRNTAFVSWRAHKEAEIKIGEDSGEGVVTAAVKELYLRLIFAYQEVIAVNPKSPRHYSRRVPSDRFECT